MNGVTELGQDSLKLIQSRVQADYLFSLARPSSEFIFHVVTLGTLICPNSLHPYSDSLKLFPVQNVTKKDMFALITISTPQEKNQNGLFENQYSEDYSIVRRVFKIYIGRYIGGL